MLAHILAYTLSSIVGIILLLIVIDYFCPIEKDFKDDGPYTDSM